MTLIPSVGFAQHCLQWVDRTPPPGLRNGHAMAYDSVRRVTVLFGGTDGSAYKGDTLEWDGTTWTRRSTTGPSPRRAHAMVYDIARGVTVLFGGYRGSFPYEFERDTWEWDGTMWTQRSVTGPSTYGLHAMVYDSARGVTVLFGGLNGDTWEWDGTTWTLRTWTRPSGRSYHAMAYDSARGVTVLFGGYSSSFKNDTWEWDGTTWSLRSTTGPSPRARHAMAYDSARGVTVLFGGEYGLGLYENEGDTWEWNGTMWTLRSTTGPSSRDGHSMVYDRARGVSFLFGGYHYPPLDYLGDTWEWDGATWAQENATALSPQIGHAMSYDSGREVTVLLGGFRNPGPYDAETWEWNGKTWTLRNTNGLPRRMGHAMAYDGARGVTVLFGGSDPPDLRGWTWEWDGTTWMLRSTTGPSARAGHAMAYDSARGVTVLFGGNPSSYPRETYESDTWEWDGTTWTLRSTTGPSPRSSHAMAYDGARGVTVLFGGYHGSFPYEFEGDTWEWDGTTWMLRSTTGPSARAGHAMAYDSARGVTVLFGGYRSVYPDEYEDDTWEWDGTTWTMLSTMGASHREGHAMAYDSARGVTVLFGGSDDYSLKGDTWELVNPPFDGDCDGDQDLGDVAGFQRCFSPGVPAEAECARFDSSGDVGVDLADFADLRDALTGPMPPPVP